MNVNKRVLGVRLAVGRGGLMPDAFAHLMSPLKPLATLDDQTFGDLVTHSAATAAGRTPKRTPEGLSASTTWEAHEALVGLFLEAARTGRPEELRSSLNSILPAARAGAILDLLGEAQKPLHEALNACGMGVSELVDVKWSRSSVVAASMQDAQGVGGSVYVVTLTTREPSGELRDLPFTTSLEGLSGLVGTLKSAVKTVERECE